MMSFSLMTWNSSINRLPVGLHTRTQVLAPPKSKLSEYRAHSKKKVRKVEQGYKKLKDHTWQMVVPVTYMPSAQFEFIFWNFERFYKHRTFLFGWINSLVFKSSGKCWRKRLAFLLLRWNWLQTHHLQINLKIIHRTHKHRNIWISFLISVMMDE